MTEKQRAWKLRVESSSASELQNLEAGNLLLDYGVRGLHLKMPKSSIEHLIRPLYEASTQKRLSAHTGQIYTILNDITVDDIVVVPHEKGKLFHLGSVVSVTVEPTDSNIRVSVRWARKSVPLAHFDQDLRYSFMAIMRLCEVKRNDAVQRLQAIASLGRDPNLS
jgi:restriction system protein